MQLLESVRFVHIGALVRSVGNVRGDDAVKDDEAKETGCVVDRRRGKEWYSMTERKD